MWWPGTELNRRRQPFQGCALPPELPGHFVCALRLYPVSDGTGRPFCGDFAGRIAPSSNRCAGNGRNLGIIATLQLFAQCFGPTSHLKLIHDRTTTVVLLGGPLGKNLLDHALCGLRRLAKPNAKLLPTHTE